VVLEPGLVPLYHQLRLLLTERIESGLWPPGHCLPAETALAAEFGVSRATVRQALHHLDREGLVERIKGVGTFVARPKVSHNLLAIGSGFDRSGMHGPVPQVELESLSRVKASASVAARLNLSTGQEVFELRKLISEADEPLMIITSWVEAARFPGFEEIGQTEVMSMRHFLREKYQTEIVLQHKEIEITILDDEEARLLSTEVNSPALLITYLSRVANGEPVEYRKWLVRGDRCKCYLDLETPELFV
jgi:GntR family transcriptional regulator